MKTQTSNSKRDKPQVPAAAEIPTEEQRDMELENVLGNLMIAQYQVDKLQGKLMDCVKGWGSEGVMKSSAFIFKHSGKWYKISIQANQMPMPQPPNESSDNDLK